MYSINSNTDQAPQTCEYNTGPSGAGEGASLRDQQSNPVGDLRSHERDKLL